MGEGAKAINENLLTCGYVQAYAYARSARGCARSCVNWGGGWKSGEEREGNWGRERRGWGDCRAERKSMENEGEEDRREGETRIGKVFSLCEKRSVAIIKGEIS